MAILRLRSRRSARRHHVFTHSELSLNDVDPQAWLADVLAHIAGHPANRLGDLLPWNLKPTALKLEP
jgi:hypothetical protein